MISKRIAGIIAGLSVLGAVAAYAQVHPLNGNSSNQYPGPRTVIPPAVHATIKDPAGAAPNPKQIPFILPKNIVWKQNGSVPGEADVANVYGDPNKPGPYAVLYRWHVGSFSRPHFHDKVRHIVVVSGTWWVSTSTKYDEKLTYPLTAGATATDEKDAIHWDGTRSGEKEEAIIYLYGEGPVATVFVDTNGKPIPLAKK